MVDIVIGIMPVAKLADNSVKQNIQSRDNFVDARILDLRPARRSRKTASDERRSQTFSSDPSGSAVIVLMINDIGQLPKDIKNGNYKISLRISPMSKKQEKEVRPFKLKA